MLVKFLEHFAISKPVCLYIQQVYLVHLLVFLLYKQLDIFLEKGYDIKEKLVVFGCLEKGDHHL